MRSCSSARVATRRCCRRFCIDVAPWSTERTNIETMIRLGVEPQALSEHLRESPLSTLEMYVRGAEDEFDDAFGISEREVVNLAAALGRGESNVTQLILYGDGLGADAANAVAEALRAKAALTRLALFSGPVGAAGWFVMDVDCS